MNNYEKYKDEIVKMLIYSTKPCRKIRQIRTYSKTTAFPLAVSAENYELCRDCEKENEKWLNGEAIEFDLSELNTGDKVVMRKKGNCYSREYEVLGNSLSVLWLRDNDNKEDSGFLISHKDMLEHYVIEEVFQ